MVRYFSIIFFLFGMNGGLLLNSIHVPYRAHSAKGTDLSQPDVD